MKHGIRLLSFTLLVLLVFSALGCAGSGQPQSTTEDSDPAASADPAENSQSEGSEEEGEEAASEAEESDLASDALLLDACSLEGCAKDGYFLIDRPISAEYRNAVDHSNRFASYQKQTKDVHHGVDFLNSTGTPVLAAADGVVVAAGDDSQKAYALHKNTYGNMIIIEHELPGVTEPVYTLYGHLSEVKVEVDDAVSAGEEIGLVGMSGGVNGSTLHFEVRYAENSFAAVQNPELWLLPLPDESGEAMGALAGRVVDAEGNFQKVENIVIEQLAGPGLPALDRFYLKTYAEKRLAGSPIFGENFAIGSLPAGEYQITFMLNGIHQMVVTVEAGKLTLVTFEL